MRADFSLLAAGLCLAAGSVVAEPSVDRGEYLVQGPAGCGNCHTPFGAAGLDMSRDLSGRLVEKNDMFTAISANITPAGRVAEWSDAELGRAIRECMRPDGSVIGPPMPCAVYRGLGDDDLASMVMYLRGVPTVENDPGTSEYNMPLPFVYGLLIDSVIVLEWGVSEDYGVYLVGLVVYCVECYLSMGL